MAKFQGATAKAAVGKTRARGVCHVERSQSLIDSRLLSNGGGNMRKWRLSGAAGEVGEGSKVKKGLRTLGRREAI